MLERLRNNKNEDQGFTLIELLVVMIIIGILAAIAIPIFLSQREKAEDSAARADVSTLGKEVATWYVDGSGVVAVTQPGGVGTPYFVDGEEVSNASDNVALRTVNIVDSTEWCIDVINDQGDAAHSADGTGISYSAAGGLEDAACAVPAAP